MELTNTGLSAIAKSHEQTMTALFNLTIRPPKKIEIEYIESIEVLERDEWSNKVRLACAINLRPF